VVTFPALISRAIREYFTAPDPDPDPNRQTPKALSPSNSASATTPRALSHKLGWLKRQVDIRIDKSAPVKSKNLAQIK